MMIKVYDDNKQIGECCDNDSMILIDFTEDIRPNGLGKRLYLCKDHKEKLLDLLLPFKFEAIGLIFYSFFYFLYNFMYQKSNVDIQYNINNFKGD